MGNQHNICQQKTDEDLHFQDDPTLYKNNPEVKQVHNKTIQQFIEENVEYFRISSRTLIAYIQQIDSFEYYINKYNKSVNLEGKKVYLSEQLVQQFETCSGECIILNYSNCQFYIGQVRFGKKQGKGLLIDKKGNKYIGQFDNNWKNGQGQLNILYPQRTYKGKWINGKLQGYGEASYQDGAHYLGQFCQGKKHGSGILTFPDGSIYEGLFQQDLMHGEGSLVTPKGREVNGQWKFGKYQMAKAERTSQSFSINQLPIL